MSRVIPKSQVPQFMRALAKRARKRVARGWDPLCECERLEPARCAERATHVDHNARPLCGDHAALETYAEKFR